MSGPSATLMGSIPSRETLTVEFKSDENRLPDHELIEAVVCLANADGGSIYLGVEDDGRVTGLHKAHKNLGGLPAMVANNTRPPVMVTVSELSVAGGRVAEIHVPRATRIVSTANGMIKRRRIGSDGRPECVPLMPEEQPSRLSDLGMLDASRLPVPGGELADLDPAERARLRQFVERFHGDAALLDLSDDELDGALSLVVRDGGHRVPSLAGLLLLGRELRLRELVPTHEVAFQVLDGESVKINEFTRAPLLRVFEWLETLFTPLNVEQELQSGLFRVGVPRVDKTAYREAIANALTHRDYARLGAVHVRFEHEALAISNPGGFVAGVTTHNLLTTEPRARNPVLADAFKRLGLVERTGRGVDLIYRGLLRYGRPPPDFTRSTSDSVVLRLDASGADLSFVKLIVEAENQRRSSLPVDSLIALTCLKQQRRLTSEELALGIQKDRVDAKRTLEALLEAGLVTPHGNTKGRTYTLAPTIYAELGKAVEYTRQTGLGPAEHEQLVLKHARTYGEIRRPDVVKLCHLSETQATRLLQGMVDRGKLEPVGKRRWRSYRPVSTLEGGGE